MMYLPASTTLKRNAALALAISLTLVGLLTCESTMAQSARISFGQTRKFPTHWDPPQVLYDQWGRTTVIPATPSDFEEYTIGTSFGVSDVQVSPPPPRRTVVVTGEVMARWLNLLRSFSDADLREATAGLTATGQPAIRPLVAALARSNAREQALMVRILAAMLASEADIALAELAATSRLATVETEAIAALRRKQSPLAQSHLVEVAMRVDAQKRPRVIRAMRAVGDSNCVGDLIRRLPREPHPQTAPGSPTSAGSALSPAAEALQALTGQAYANNAKQWQVWWQANGRNFHF